MALLPSPNIAGMGKQSSLPSSCISTWLFNSSSIFSNESKFFVVVVVDDDASVDAALDALDAAPVVVATGVVAYVVVAAPVAR